LTCYGFTNKNTYGCFFESSVPIRKGLCALGVCGSETNDQVKSTSAASDWKISQSDQERKLPEQGFPAKDGIFDRCRVSGIFNRKSKIENNQSKEVSHERRRQLKKKPVRSKRKLWYFHTGASNRKKRTAEYRTRNRRILKDGIASL